MKVMEQNYIMERTANGEGKYTENNSFQIWTITIGVTLKYKLMINFGWFYRSSIFYFSDQNSTFLIKVLLF